MCLKTMQFTYVDHMSTTIIKMQNHPTVVLVLLISNLIYGQKTCSVMISVLLNVPKFVSQSKIQFILLNASRALEKNVHFYVKWNILFI